ncbi:MAG: tRNA (adenosine(37)-N6)-threonylcarbamoyltransferase complex ATPase subunit type 1 TsaE [Acidimicrobiia bacterium]|nr:tRNA (adenosine(37)-N6)-threonylcarbamoyltransferase complex ATPase subunit type 1 TsaE [Acidimicrobiia bacterium]NNJ48064.1 tRNA (adenosine(37)-N6)-threonylcarbamoyltransferase complex ATPase subunit type 1 TsaE [Acidimicrobiia bacterium]NNL12116.1 tRNA (adenosine(37)-N6)-threonylcarbamoyltransferase complex ATPase subunit type 1 TsaE [Acidimicrobiia bacterium]RZV47636.1 MAG: tRNA (adenosine(37)-N6)-threonylcarbamoyltransferase complex ATPase subunit type 1 TsaE [Acidimicrobiia bacterium]
MSVEVLCPTSADTMAVGRRLAGLIWAGDVVLIDGELGVGKTTFVAGLAEGLGVEEPITSPTFILMRTYPGLLPLTHADVYRLDTLAEIEDLELTEASADGVLAVEWGTAIEQWMPADHLVVRLRLGDDEVRRIELVPYGNWATRPLQEVTG